MFRSLASAHSPTELTQDVMKESDEDGSLHRSL